MIVAILGVELDPEWRARDYVGTIFATLWSGTRSPYCRASRVTASRDIFFVMTGWDDIAHIRRHLWTPGFNRASNQLQIMGARHAVCFSRRDGLPEWSEATRCWRRAWQRKNPGERLPRGGEILHCDDAGHTGAGALAAFYHSAVRPSVN